MGWERREPTDCYPGEVAGGCLCSTIERGMLTDGELRLSASGCPLAQVVAHYLLGRVKLGPRDVQLGYRWEPAHLDSAGALLHLSVPYPAHQLEGTG